MFIFPAAGATNYTTEALEHACHFFYEFPEKLKLAVMNNYLVNPTGLIFGWYEHDLLQEHHNFWIKRVFNIKNLTFDSVFLRDTVALNIRKFGDLRERFYGMLGLGQRRSTRVKAQVEADIKVLASTFIQSKSHTFHSGRTQPFTTMDAISVGINKLSNGVLSSFLNRPTVDADTTFVGEP